MNYLKGKFAPPIKFPAALASPKCTHLVRSFDRSEHERIRAELLDQETAFCRQYCQSHRDDVPIHFSPITRRVGNCWQVMQLIVIVPRAEFGTWFVVGHVGEIRACDLLRFPHVRLEAYTHPSGEG